MLTEENKQKARESIASLNDINSDSLYLIKSYVMELETKREAIDRIHIALIQASKGEISQVKAFTDVIDIVTMVQG